MRDPINLKKEVIEFKKERILWALDIADFNKAEAARLLTINRTTLVEMIKRVGLSEHIGKPYRKNI